MPRRIVTARERVEMLSPWRIAAEDEKDTRTCEHQGSSNWPDYCVGCRRAKSKHTAGRPRRFTQDYERIGGDYFPTDVISRYMVRKEEGFADEKSAYQPGPPLSERIKNEGYEKPVVLCTDGRSGYVEDGHHRVDNARTQGHSHVPVEVWWRTPQEDGSPMTSNLADPWLKGWLTDMRKGRETVGRRKFAERADDFRWERSFDGPGGWILVTRTPDGNPVTVETEPTRGQRSAALGPERPATAININDTHQDYTGQILRGEKTIETRNTNSLRTLIGGRYGISRTHDNSRKFPAMVVGYATLGEPKLYENAEDFDADYDLHRVAPDSIHHISKSPTGVKFGYPLHNVEHEPEPFPPGPGNRKWRSITAIQQPPEGLNFQHWATNKQIADHFGRFDMPIIAPAVTAHLDGEMVGSVEWHPHYDNAPERHGEVSMIDVPERHRRKGIGTALYDWARDNVEPKLHHSPRQSYDGEVWAAAEEDRQHDPSYRTWKSRGKS